MKIKKFKVFVITFILIGVVCMSGCSFTIDPTDTTLKHTITDTYRGITNKVDVASMTIKDIAFDTHKKYGYTVYIKENSKFTAYLVLTSDYNGNTLLLRQALLDKPHAFNVDSYGNSGYYKDSDISKFLNKDFINTLDDVPREAIVTSEIIIASVSSLGIAGTDTEKLNQKVFLLSYTELDLYDSAVVAKEGKALSYFSNPDNRIALSNNKPCSWGLRSAETWGSNTSIGIGPTGIIGYGGVDSENGVRPAFCIKNTQKIEKSDKIIAGQTVYVIAEN